MCTKDIYRESFYLSCLNLVAGMLLLSSSTLAFILFVKLGSPVFGTNGKLISILLFLGFCFETHYLITTYIGSIVETIHVSIIAKIFSNGIVLMKVSA